MLKPWPAAAHEVAALRAHCASCAAGPGWTALAHLAVGAGRAPEPEIREVAQQALWSAGIARLAGAYLQPYPRRPWADGAAVLRQRAQPTADMLRRSDVPLFQSAFVPAPHWSIPLRRCAWL